MTLADGVLFSPAVCGSDRFFPIKIAARPGNEKINLAARKAFCSFNMQLKCDGKRHRLAVTATFPASIKLSGAVLSRSGCQAVRAPSWRGVRKTNLSHTPASTNNLSIHVTAGAANSPAALLLAAAGVAPGPWGAPRTGMLLCHGGGCGVTCESLGVDEDPLHGLAFLHRQQQVDFVGAVGLGPGEGLWGGWQRLACAGSRQPPPALLWSAWLGQGASCHRGGARGQEVALVCPGAKADIPCQSLASQQDLPEGPGARACPGGAHWKTMVQFCQSKGK